MITQNKTVTSTASFNVIPTIASSFPTNAVKGQTYTLGGANLAKTSAIRFGNSAAFAPTNATATQVSFVVPNDATSGAIQITTTGGVASTPASQPIQVADALKLYSFSPSSGRVGTAVTLSGEGFTSPSQAFVGNSLSAPVNVTSSKVASFNVPQTATTGPVRVQVGNSTVVSASSFTVITDPNPVTISSISPLYGEPQTPIRISGTRLQFATFVKIGAVNMPLKKVQLVTGEYVIDSVIPGAAVTAPIVVGNEYEQAKSFEDFVVNRLTISNISPISGPPGTQVTIDGSALEYVTTAKIGNITLDAQYYAPPTGGPGQLKVVIPSGAYSAPIVLGTKSQSAQSQQVFTVK